MKPIKGMCIGVLVAALCACNANELAEDPPAATADSGSRAPADAKSDTPGVANREDALGPPVDTADAPDNAGKGPDLIVPPPVVKGPPCSVPTAEGMGVSPGQSPWPSFSPGELLKINSLTDLVYPLAANQLPNKAWGVKPWWMEPGNDPWSEYPDWEDGYVDPGHSFTGDEERWKCGYSYVVEVPMGYDPEKIHPVLIFLHGSIELDDSALNWYHHELRKSFHRPLGDPYVYVAPIKLEIDWDPKKVQDVLADVKANMNVDEDRVYLTGLSMGGRGTFIVAAELAQAFAALLSLSPHHEPYSYVSLAEAVAHLPIWLMHGTVDEISSYEVALEMLQALENAGAEVAFKNTWGPKAPLGHWGWEHIYSDPAVMEWLLGWKRPGSQ